MTAKATKPARALPLQAVRALGGENVVDLLAHQHRQIRLGFLRAALPGPQRRRNLDRLTRLPAVHEAAGEALVHPVARRALKHGRELIARRRNEAKEAKRLLVRLRRTGPYGSGYLRQLNQFHRAVTGQAAREERGSRPHCARFSARPGCACWARRSDSPRRTHRPGHSAGPTMRWQTS
ncbi:hemerythrin domain-containing protein [Streptomyces pimonensis]|uniref:hemerythrin domain-containing protein n=1 Tax=Streptomyces pimonensis TaxID=2860288 RepID=UPI003529344F